MDSTKTTKPTIYDLLPSIIGGKTLAKPIHIIAKFANKSEQYVGKVIKKMHEDGDVHINHWERGEVGPYVAFFKYGPGEDAERPKALTRTERSRRYRSTENGKRVCKEINDRWNASERGTEYRKKYDQSKWIRKKLESGGLARIDPLMAAIYGVSNGNHS